ncbi:hypothetical protein K1X76_08435 [bacterium]|nr:hypothetical protein [bacterium]
MEKELENIASTKKKDNKKGENRLISPDPVRKKFITELLHAFAARKISFAELTRLHPKKIKQIAEIGFVKLRHGRYKDARRIFEALTFLDHKNSFHHLALAGAYQKLELFVDAIYQYTEALRIEPDNINAMVNRGELYLRRKSYRKAAEDFRNAILKDETGKDRFANRARSLVIAIKRSLAQDKEEALKPKKIPTSPANKATLSPFKFNMKKK